MKHIAYLTILALFVLGVFVLTQPAQAAEDSTAPVLRSFDLSPTTINTADESQTVIITMRVTDDLSGVRYYSADHPNQTAAGWMQVNLKPLIGTQRVEAIWNFTRVSGDANDGVYQHGITIPKWAKSGIWTVEYVVLFDELGNERTLYTAALNEMFPDAHLTVANTQTDTSVTIEEEWVFANSTTNTTVTFPADTQVTRADGGSFQFYKMVNQDVDITGLDVDNLAEDVIKSLRIGVPGLNLEFSKDVTVSVKVSTRTEDTIDDEGYTIPGEIPYLGETLLIQALEEAGDAWANETTCTVVASGDSGVCEFTVNHATYFAVAQAPVRTIVTGTKAGGGPEVRVFDTAGTLLNSFDAYTNWWGGINVAVGDINGDGEKEIIVSTRTGGIPRVRIFDSEGNNKGWDFDAFASGFRGGVNLAVGDIEGDGMDEIVVAPMGGGAPQVRIFGMRNGSIVPVTENFYAYDTNFRGGIALSIGDIEGDGIGDIITTPISGGGPHVRVFGVKSKRYVPVTLGVMAFDPSFRGGVTTAMADFNANGKDEIVAGIYSNGGPQVRMIGVGSNKALALSSPGFMAFAPVFRGGVSVAALDTNGNGREEVIVGVGGQDVGWVKIMSSDGRLLSPVFAAYGKDYQGGITLAAGVF